MITMVNVNPALITDQSPHGRMSPLLSNLILTASFVENNTITLRDCKGVE